MDDYSVIGRSLFKKETNIQLFVGLKVQLSTGEQGIIDSAFGQSGKFKIHIPGECSCIPAENVGEIEGLSRVKTLLARKQAWIQGGDWTGTRSGLNFIPLFNIWDTS